MKTDAEAESDPRDRWVRLVGSFILAFGDIELTSFMLWSNYYPHDKPPNNFKERTSKILGSLKLDESRSKEIAPLLVKALQLADRRNTVAHHPLQVQVFKHSITGKLFTELAISSETTDDYITDEELERIGAEARSIAKALYRAIFTKSAAAEG